MGTVRACVSDTYASMRDDAVEAVLDYVDGEGLSPTELLDILEGAPDAGAESVHRLHAEVVEATRDRIEAKGYTPTEIATKLPSTRREFVERFMGGRELVSLKRSLSMLEACGLRARLVITPDESRSPRRKADTPRAVYERAPSALPHQGRA